MFFALIVEYHNKEKTMSDLPNRRPCVTEDVGMGLSVTVSYHPETGKACEVFLTGRGKASDNPMQEALYNLGVCASSLMQDKPFAEAEKSFIQQSAQ
jgi:hypothetical protein